MEVVQGRKLIPERGKAASVHPRFQKVQIVYYLSRNGHLEHPHFMEVTHLPHQPLRLKDVMDRLTVLRGKGMPLLYSWSCKSDFEFPKEFANIPTVDEVPPWFHNLARESYEDSFSMSYKNGYVWNDLAENDVIYPSEGAEYVLKGSELIEGCTEKLLHLQVNNGELMNSQNLQAVRKSVASKRQNAAEEMVNSKYDHHEEEAEDEEFEEKTSCTTPHSRCSRGVSTDEIEEFKQQKNNGGPSELSPDSNPFSSPPSTTSSSHSDKPINHNNGVTSKRFEDGLNEPLMSRNSMLLSLIACGGSLSFRKTVPPPAANQLPMPSVAARKSGVAEKEDAMMIGSMSENPRFGNLQAEEKEYFSGSIVESIVAERNEVEPKLKKSSSHNEERSRMGGLVEAAEGEVQKEKGVKGKCIPRKKSCNSK